MKIVIVTVYNSENCGSFFQAYALGKSLELLGHDVCYLNRPVQGTSHSFVSVMLDSAKALLRYGFKAFIMVWRRHYKFTNAQKCFRCIPYGVSENQGDVCYVIGSDTIWDFKSNYFRKNANLYTGAAMGAMRYLFYAASSANTSPEDIERLGVDVTAISKAFAVSVRDQQAYDIAKNAGASEVTQVLDPTFLIDREVYDDFIKKHNTSERYILIYCFEKIPDNIYNGVLAFAHQHDLSIHTLGCQKNEGAKAFVPAPEEFITNYANASYVITNTYHGVLFSIIFQKQFVVMGKKKEKIKSLLGELGLHERQIGADDSFAEQLMKPIDYSMISNQVESMRSISMDYLDNNTR